MDKNLNFVYEKLLDETAANLKKNKINAYIVKDLEDLPATLKKFLSPGDKVAVGGSMTLFETEVINMLREGDYDFLDRYEPGLTPEATRAIFVESFSADVYITSTNAVTKDGMLFNIDGTGNRVAAMAFGPKKVIVLAGRNKIAQNLDEAMVRVKEIVAPANAKRLNLRTPCTVTGVCSNCTSPDRICNDYHITKYQRDPDRMHVLLINEAFGY
ncbi:MAG: hypothetical protein AVO33_06445 [delta proteobacterium ML8_F1]|nr:MAG: hypothetical protein AVO33_06445 [delta proteobacterium ML8_F1]